MEKNIVLQIENTRNTLATVINNSGLPWTIVEMIIKDIHDQCATMADNEVSYLREQSEKEENHEEEPTAQVNDDTPTDDIEVEDVE